jgi:hypothetical protein
MCGSLAYDALQTMFPPSTRDSVTIIPVNFEGSLVFLSPNSVSIAIKSLPKTLNAAYTTVFGDVYSACCSPDEM